ncbi:MAG: tetratricopeptide repeat protein [Hyphomonadaceae bacterium]|nr:tetratricopeptide repeat protein [Hyphomonadaceae bacterium]
MAHARLLQRIAIVISAAFALALVGAAGSGGGGGAGGASAPSGPGFDVAATYRDGVAALQRGDYEAALRDLRRVQRVARDDASANYALGLAYVGLGRHDEAVRPFERAARDDAAPADARVQLALAHLHLGDRAKADEQRVALETAIAACAACTPARRAELQAAHAQIVQALSAAPAASPTTGWLLPGEAEGRAAYAEGVAQTNAGNFAAAFDAFQRAEIALGPHPDVLTYLGFTSRRLGRADAALTFYRRALAIDPDHRGAHEYLGEHFVQTGRLEDARSQLAQLDRLCPYGCAEREALNRRIVAAQ